MSLIPLPSGLPVINRNEELIFAGVGLSGGGANLDIAFTANNKCVDLMKSIANVNVKNGTYIATTVNGFHLLRDCIVNVKCAFASQFTTALSKNFYLGNYPLSGTYEYLNVNRSSVNVVTAMTNSVQAQFINQDIFVKSGSTILLVDSGASYVTTFRFVDQSIVNGFAQIALTLKTLFN